MIKCQRKGFNKQAIKFNMRFHHRTIMIIPSRKKWNWQNIFQMSNEHSENRGEETTYN